MCCSYVVVAASMFIECVWTVAARACEIVAWNLFAIKAISLKVSPKSAKRVQVVILYLH